VGRICTGIHAPSCPSGGVYAMRSTFYERRHYLCVVCLTSVEVGRVSVQQQHVKGDRVLLHSYKTKAMRKVIAV